MNAVLAAVALVCLALLLLTIRRVPEGQAWTVHRFGRYLRTLRPGRHAVWPLLDRVARQVSLTGHHIEWPAPQAGDAQARADLYFQILDPLQTGDGLDAVDELVATQVEAALTRIAAPASADAPMLADRLKDELNQRLGGKGLRVIRCALHAPA